MPKLDQAVADLVKSDGLPRLATADDDSQHILYLNGTIVQSTVAADWPPPLPTDPTPAQIATAIAARATAETTRKQSAIALRNRVVTVAQSAVGSQLDALTAVQVRALLACLLWKAGGLGSDGAINPLADWL